MLANPRILPLQDFDLDATTTETTSAPTAAPFDLRSPEVQEVISWVSDRGYILILLIIICATTIICFHLLRERWNHHITHQHRQCHAPAVTPKSSPRSTV